MYILVLTEFYSISLSIEILTSGRYYDKYKFDNTFCELDHSMISKCYNCSKIIIIKILKSS